MASQSQSVANNSDSIIEKVINSLFYFYLLATSISFYSSSPVLNFFLMFRFQL